MMGGLHFKPDGASASCVAGRRTEDQVVELDLFGPHRVGMARPLLVAPKPAGEKIPGDGAVSAGQGCGARVGSGPFAAAVAWALDRFGQHGRFESIRTVAKKKWGEPQKFHRRAFDASGPDS